MEMTSYFQPVVDSRTRSTRRGGEVLAGVERPRFGGPRTASSPESHRHPRPAHPFAAIVRRHVACRENACKSAPRASSQRFSEVGCQRSSIDSLVYVDAMRERGVNKRGRGRREYERESAAKTLHQHKQC